MKIIRRPPKVSSWKGQAMCPRCKAVLEVEFDDLTFRPGDQRDGSAYSFKCPCCGHEVWLDASLVKP
jgi:hypothetical protein